MSEYTPGGEASGFGGGDAGGLGGHEHGGHGHIGHGHVGQGHGNNLIAHLLGLDHDNPHGGHGAQYHGGAHEDHGHLHGEHPLPHQSVGWTSALQAFNLTNLLQGINVTPNIMFILLFVGFAVWLYVVYWIRHHEPLANSVLGTRAHSRTETADRAMLYGTRHALPFHTSPSTGEIYVPNSPMVRPTHPQYGSAGPIGSAGAAGAAQVNPQPVQTVVPTPPAVPLPAPYTSQAALPGVPGQTREPESPALPGSAYLVPVESGRSTRVKMIVNR